MFDPTHDKQYQKSGIRQGRFNRSTKAASTQRKSFRKKGERINYQFMFAEHLASSGKFSLRRIQDAVDVMQWTGSHWEVVHQEVGRNLAWDWLNQYEPNDTTHNRAKDCWEAAKLHLGVHRPFPTKEIERGSYILPMQDTYLHIGKDGSITPNAPNKDYGFTFAIPFKAGIKGNTYSPKPVPSSSRFGKFLAQAMPDEDMRNLLQEQCALTFMPTGWHQLATWWFGRGRDGKGTLMKILRRFHSNPVSLKLHKLDRDHELKALVDASLVTVDEVSKGKWPEETFKSCVSGDGIMINPKNKDIFSYNPHAPWLIASNDEPFITDKSNGVWRRLIPIRWEHSVPEDKEIQDLDRLIVEHENAIVLDWLLEGMQRILQRGKPLKGSLLPKRTQELISRLRGGNDSIRAWIEDEGICYSEVDTHLHTKAEVYAAYEEHCMESHGSLISPNAFWRILNQNPDFTDILASAKKYREGSKRVRKIRIALTPEEIEEAKAEAKAIEIARTLPPTRLDEMNDDIDF